MNINLSIEDIFVIISLVLLLILFAFRNQIKENNFFCKFKKLLKTVLGI